MTNAELGQGIRNGDESAFTTFFDRHYGWVYRRALKFLKSHEDAEDAASKVFVKAWQHREKYNAEKGMFMAWFNMLCRNLLIDVKRRKKNANDKCWYGDLQETERHALLEHEPDTRKSALDVLIAEEQQKRIEDALCRIKRPEHRLAWILHHFEGYTYDKISEIIKRPKGTCKIWVYRCNQLLQGLLADA